MALAGGGGDSGSWVVGTRGHIYVGSQVLQQLGQPKWRHKPEPGSGTRDQLVAVDAAPGAVVHDAGRGWADGKFLWSITPIGCSALRVAQTHTRTDSSHALLWGDQKRTIVGKIQPFRELMKVNRH